MRLGGNMRELWQRRSAAAFCLVVALLGALSAYYRVGVFPPGLQSRELEIATASTQVLVDTPNSTVLDLKADTFSFQSMTNRAVLLGNIMVSEPVLAYVGRRAGIPAGAIRATTPLTPEFPRPFAEVGREPHTSDLLQSSDQYRLSIRANPTVPILTVIAQAPRATTAGALANAAVAGLRDYLASVARTERIDPRRQVTLEQLGRAKGAVVNGGQRAQASVVFFLVGLGLAAMLLRFASLVLRGWRASRPEDAGDHPDATSEPPPARERPQAVDLAIR